MHHLPLIKLIIEGPLERAHRRPSIYVRQTVAGWRVKACQPKSAIPRRRYHGDMYTTYFAISVSLTYLCDVSSESRVHFSAKWWRKHGENMKMSCKMHAVEHIMTNKLPKKVHKQEMHIFPVDFANSRCHKQFQNGRNPCGWSAGEGLFGMIVH